MPRSCWNLRTVLAAATLWAAAVSAGLADEDFPLFAPPAETQTAPAPAAPGVVDYSEALSPFIQSDAPPPVVEETPPLPPEDQPAYPEVAPPPREQAPPPAGAAALSPTAPPMMTDAPPIAGPPPAVGTPSCCVNQAPCGPVYHCREPKSLMGTGLINWFRSRDKKGTCCVQPPCCPPTQPACCEPVYSCREPQSLMDGTRLFDWFRSSKSDGCCPPDCQPVCKVKQPVCEVKTQCPGDCECPAHCGPKLKWWDTAWFAQHETPCPPSPPTCKKDSWPSWSHSGDTTQYYADPYGHQPIAPPEGRPLYLVNMVGGLLACCNPFGGSECDPYSGYPRGLLACGHRGRGCHPGYGYCHPGCPPHGFAGAGGGPCDTNGDGLCDVCSFRCVFGTCPIGHRCLSGQAAGVGIARITGKLGYILPAGYSPVGSYTMGYPLNPDYADPRNGNVYAAQGYGVPVAVPLAPQVDHTWNYGWGVPSSRLTPISRSPMGR